MVNKFLIIFFLTHRNELWIPILLWNGFYGKRLTNTKSVWFSFKKIILFVYFWLCWPLLLCGFFSSSASRGYSLVGMYGFFTVVASLLSMAIRCVNFRNYGSQALGHRLNSGGAQALLPQGMGSSWNQGSNLCALHWQALYLDIDFTTEPPDKPVKVSLNPFTVKKKTLNWVHIFNNNVITLVLKTAKHHWVKIKKT